MPIFSNGKRKWTFLALAAVLAVVGWWLWLSWWYWLLVVILLVAYLWVMSPMGLLLWTTVVLLLGALGLGGWRFIEGRAANALETLTECRRKMGPGQCAIDTTQFREVPGGLLALHDTSASVLCRTRTLTDKPVCDDHVTRIIRGEGK